MAIKVIGSQTSEFIQRQGIQLKKTTISILLLSSIIVGCILSAVESQANSAYRYHVLYKNSETYKMIHGDEDDTEESDDVQEPQFDGWGNLVDEPPPENTYSKEDTMSNEEIIDTTTENVDGK